MEPCPKHNSFSSDDNNANKSAAAPASPASKVTRAKQQLFKMKKLTFDVSVKAPAATAKGHGIGIDCGAARSPRKSHLLSAISEHSGDDRLSRDERRQFQEAIYTKKSLARKNYPM